MSFWKDLLKRAEEETPPSVAAVVLKALDQGKIAEIIPALPAVEREVALWHTRQFNVHNKRWELLYLLLGLLFGGGGGIGYGLVKGAVKSTGEQTVPVEE